VNSIITSSTKILTAHLAKLAYLYIRQSSLMQVKQNCESTDLQYRLVERATRLGWPADRVQIIDEDLGKSGASSENRSGFQHLITEVSLGKVGLVVSLDASRLARNNSDWYKLLELCSIFGVLIADAEQLYDPRNYHDRLLLGLTGMMSEAELHHLRMRLQTGSRNKAERGQLQLPLPAGLARTRTGEIILNPDQEIQERIGLVFEKFCQLGSARSVLRYLQQNQFQLPARPLIGSSPQEIVWSPATASYILQILKNPAYAGAYVYGRQKFEPTQRKAGRPNSGRVSVPIEQWVVCIEQAHPGYISWEEYMANQHKLQSNSNNYKKGRSGAVRQGQALLQGIVFCGRCGRQMKLHYSGPKGNYPVYQCDTDHHNVNKPICQAVRALQIDEETERLILAALAPDQIAIAVAALTEIEKETALLERQWLLKRERAQYEAERAHRQYNSVEPENRLVARSLEKIWEEKLRQLEKIEQGYKQWQKQNQVAITETDRAEILALGENLPKLWYDPNTTPADRKQIIRLLIRDVNLDQMRVSGKIWVKINWQTGVSSQHWVKRRVSRYKDHADLESLERRVRELRDAGNKDADIAEQINKEGFATTRGTRFHQQLIFLLRKRWGIAATRVSGKDRNPLRWPDGSYSIQGIAKLLGVSRATVYKWLMDGILKGKQESHRGSWKISLTNGQIKKLKARLGRKN
jgi:DNA invertase Pin-like site-specific DNA recombinase